MEAAVGTWRPCFAEVRSLESHREEGFELGPRHDQICILERAF